MKTLILQCIIYLIPIVAWTQSEWGCSYQLKSGTLAAHRGSMADLPQQLAWASEFSFFKHLHQPDSWIEDYKDPTVGATLFMGSVGNNDVLGRFIALYGFSELPFIALEHFELSWKLGTGLAVTNRKFDTNFNPENIAIGSHLNMMVVMALKAQYRLNKSSYSLGLDITHFSNSAFKVPNLGLNVPYLSLGYSRKFGNVRNSKIDAKAQFIRKKIYFGASLMGSVKELMPEGGAKYPIYAGNLFARSTLGPKAGFEFGLDVFSNQAHTNFEPLVSKTQWTLLQLGIYSAYFVPMNHIHFVFGMGAYIRDWYKPNGPIYHRIGVRYQWFNGLFGHMAIKSHWAKADYLELGIGFVFKRAN